MKWLLKFKLRLILFAARRHPFIQGEYRDEYREKYGITGI